MTEARLITIPFSHYCEKARWILDATGLPYREEKHSPLAHKRATRAVGGDSVPVLVHETRVFLDSTDIALYADDVAPRERKIIPEDEGGRSSVLALEDELDETLGKDARLLAYWHMFADPRSAHEFVGRMLNLRSSLLRRAAALAFRALIFRAYDVNKETARDADARIRSTFASVSEAMGARDYVVGDRVTLADLTLASLAAPIMLPPEHPVMGRASEDPPPGVAALRAELMTTRAGEHVMRMYRDHRR